MPFYDYECQSCKHLFVESHTIVDREKPEKEPCPICKEQQVKKIINAPAVCDSVIVGVTKPPSDFTNHVLKPMENYYKGKGIKLR